MRDCRDTVFIRGVYYRFGPVGTKTSHVMPSPAEQFPVIMIDGANIPIEINSTECTPDFFERLIPVSAEGGAS